MFQGSRAFNVPCCVKVQGGPSSFVGDGDLHEGWGGGEGEGAQISPK